MVWDTVVILYVPQPLAVMVLITDVTLCSCKTDKNICVSKQVSRLYVAFQRGFAGGNLQSTNTPGPQISSWEALRFIAVNIHTSTHIQINKVLKQTSSTWAGITFSYDQNSLLAALPLKQTSLKGFLKSKVSVPRSNQIHCAGSYADLRW